MLNRLALSVLLVLLCSNADAALIGSMSDRFTGTTIDTSKWRVTTQTNGTITQSDQMVFNCTSSSCALQFDGLAPDYSIYNSGVFVQIPVTAPSSFTTSFYAGTGGNPADIQNSLRWRISGTAIAARYVIASTNTDVATANDYSATKYKWLRIRESSGTLYWDYSGDGVNWTNFGSIATASVALNFNYMTPIMYSSSTASGTVYYDEYNATPVSGSNYIGSGKWGTGVFK